MKLSDTINGLTQRIDYNLPVIKSRDDRYRGKTQLRYATDDVSGDLKYFGVNLSRLAVDAVAERMRVKRVEATVRGNDVSDRAQSVWMHSNLDQTLNSILVDALALGAAYLTVWVDANGMTTITPENAKSMAVERDPVNRQVTSAVKRWSVTGPSGAIQEEHLIFYGADKIKHYRQLATGGEWEEVSSVDNPLGQSPVVPLVNIDRIGDTHGHSVIDDIGHLVDALSKILADMLVASEDVARPRRWATGVDLEEEDSPGDIDGFTADSAQEPKGESTPVVSPFESGNRMFTVESPEAKFGQLPGADLAGYKTAVDLLTQQIMSVSALPAHMVGITSANPASADGMRAAEASITARAESRIRVLGIPLEVAVKLALAIEYGVAPHEVTVRLVWGSPATKSTAQEADAVTKLHSLGIITTEEAREIIGVDGL